MSIKEHHWKLKHSGTPQLTCPYCLEAQDVGQHTIPCENVPHYCFCCGRKFAFTAQAIVKYSSIPIRAPQHNESSGDSDD